MKNNTETKLEMAKRLSLGFWNREAKDVIVLFPSQSVYVDTKPEDIQEHVIATQQEIVIVKLDGKMVTENDEKFTEEIKKEPAFGKKKENKKL